MRFKERQKRPATTAAARWTARLAVMAIGLCVSAEAGQISVPEYQNRRGSISVGEGDGVGIESYSLPSQDRMVIAARLRFDEYETPSSAAEIIRLDADEGFAFLLQVFPNDLLRPRIQGAGGDDVVLNLGSIGADVPLNTDMLFVFWHDRETLDPAAFPRGFAVGDTKTTYAVLLDGSGNVIRQSSQAGPPSAIKAPRGLEVGWQGSASTIKISDLAIFSRSSMIGDEESVFSGAAAVDVARRVVDVEHFGSQNRSAAEDVWPFSHETFGGLVDAGDVGLQAIVGDNGFSTVLGGPAWSAVSLGPALEPSDDPVLSEASGIPPDGAVRAEGLDELRRLLQDASASGGVLANDGDSFARQDVAAREPLHFVQGLIDAGNSFTAFSPMASPSGTSELIQFTDISPSGVSYETILRGGGSPNPFPLNDTAYGVIGMPLHRFTADNFEPGTPLIRFDVNPTDGVLTTPWFGNGDRIKARVGLFVGTQTSDGTLREYQGPIRFVGLNGSGEEVDSLTLTADSGPFRADSFFDGADPAVIDATSYERLGSGVETPHRGHINMHRFDLELGTQGDTRAIRIELPDDAAGDPSSGLDQVVIATPTIYLADVDGRPVPGIHHISRSESSASVRDFTSVEDTGPKKPNDEQAARILDARRVTPTGSPFISVMTIATENSDPDVHGPEVHAYVDRAKARAQDGAAAGEFLAFWIGNFAHAVTGARSSLGASRARVIEWNATEYDASIARPDLAFYSNLDATRGYVGVDLPTAADDFDTFGRGEAAEASMDPILIERGFGIGDLDGDWLDGGVLHLGAPRTTAETFARLKVEAIQTAGCNRADIALPLGVLDDADLLAFLTTLESGGIGGDFDRDGERTIFDLLRYLDVYEAGCP